MKEAIHSIDGELFRLNSAISREEIRNYKKLADKGIYLCPYCNAELMIKSGDHREVHFSHRHSESCEPSKLADEAEKKYRKQVARETAKHKTMVDIIYDEMKTQSRFRTDLFVDYGYRAKKELLKYPDIWAKFGDIEIAISVVTNVTPSSDTKLSKDIENRHKYFLDNGMRPLWFVERKEWSIEKEKQSIVLWDAELLIALHTKEDRKWEEMLRPLAKDSSFFERFNYPPSMSAMSIDIRSMYYIYPTEERIVVKVQRFIKDRTTKPLRAFMINDGYEISFSKALYKLQLGDSDIEDQERQKFLKKFEELGQKWLEKNQVVEKRKDKTMERINSWNEDNRDRKSFSNTPNEARWGKCQICGKYTNDWWMFDGSTNTCKCNDCK
ncbi:competence protein CoiA family protein [Brevibacillus agri]|uniref:competence protein CoiA family protein n=1 Tax=Brevibacillus agri TaxID=51101 RepID=UPI0018CE21FC|nr:competence protein CoiA family protein [Brevibacillus agri]